MTWITEHGDLAFNRRHAGIGEVVEGSLNQEERVSFANDKTKGAVDSCQPA
ncbi:hypothetical protein SAMN04487959_108113 [Modicisalibacter xianhensis]|uniref:Uncharacterized protein n=1 Tax=Modicisalibacter xianhensis TaxID=442341 RepID=A0A1I3CB36_9GAMM|nr:hypothetical protein SAMN04487959_108113 [Halomonas xianhensis]